jgi:hypothetical protein
LDKYAYSFVTMEHRGEIIKKAIEESRISITEIAKRMKKSRQWLYDQFDNPNVSLEHVSAIGKIIRYDFSEEIKAYTFVSEPHQKYRKSDDSDWKEKYYSFLEEYSIILKKLNDLMEKG